MRIHALLRIGFQFTPDWSHYWAHHAAIASPTDLTPLAIIQVSKQSRACTLTGVCGVARAAHHLLQANKVLLAHGAWVPARAGQQQMHNNSQYNQLQPVLEPTVQFVLNGHPGR
jgi:hypothetical protein